MFLETIKIENGQIYNIEYHQKRFDKTRSELLNAKSKIDLQNFIKTPKDGLYRCKIIYDGNDIISIEYTPYKQKEFKKFIMLETEIEYSYKYSDRDYFEKLSKEYNEFDDIIFYKNGMMTDTTIANIAFYDDTNWITPKMPLLFGTTRTRLLDSGFLSEKDIKVDEILKFQKFAIMNAMIGFYEIKDFIIKGI